MEKDVLNIEYQPGEQEVRECLKWILKDNHMIFGEECWLDKDKEDCMGDKKYNIVDMLFSDYFAHDLVALELKGKYVPKKKALEQVKTYRKLPTLLILFVLVIVLIRNLLRNVKKLVLVLFLYL